MAVRPIVVATLIITTCRTGGTEPLPTRPPTTARASPALARNAFDFSPVAPGANEQPGGRRHSLLHRHIERSAWQQFLEPDAIVFVFGSAAIGATAFYAYEPSTKAFLFAQEGGAERRSVTIPNWQVATGAVFAPVLVASSGGDARWFHAKGIVQSLITTAALTEVSKNLFARHRPVYDAMSGADDRKSFFSGHSSLTLAATTYAGLYLREHVFSRWRGDALVTWYELPTYMALATASVWIPKTRIEDRMHHTSDVIVGGVVGASLSTAFFVWQERRFRRDRRRADDQLVVTPLIDTPGAAVAMAFD